MPTIAISTKYIPVPIITWIATIKSVKGKKNFFLITSVYNNYIKVRNDIQKQFLKKEKKKSIVNSKAQKYEQILRIIFFGDV